MRIENGCTAILTIGLLVCVSPFGCAKRENLESPGPGEGEKAESSIPVEDEPSDYFPTDTGTRWIYEIEKGEVDPLHYRVTRWPLRNGKVATTSTRGLFFRPPLGDRALKTFLLEMSVKGPASKQGPLMWPAGIELDIEKDELGFFEDAEQVFWAITFSGRFEVWTVVTYLPDTSTIVGGSWGSWGQEEGYSLRVVFFGEAPGTRIGIGEKSKDNLLFTGVDTEVPEYEGTPLIHFVRTVEPAEKEEGEDRSYHEKGFSEDMWFAKGKGLVRLEQKVDGEVSMTWTLMEFSE